MKTYLLALSCLLFASSVLAAPDPDHTADRSVTAFPVIVPADNDYFILTDTSNSGLFGKTTVANIKTLFAAPLGADDNYVTDAEKTRIGDLEAADNVVFGNITAEGGTLKAGVGGTTQGALVLATNTDPIYTAGLMPAASPSEIVALKFPPTMPGGANYLLNFDADGTGGWTDPATFGGDDLGSAAASDVVALFASGSCSGYLKSDGTCDSPAGTGDMVLANVQSVTGLKTFDSLKLAVKGASTGTTAIENTNNTATNYTLALPNADGTLARLSDIPASATGLSFTPNGSIEATNVQAAIQEVRDEATGLSSLPTADNQLLQATGAGTYAWTSTLDGIGNITGAGTYNNITITQPATGATLTLVEGSTLATSGAYSLTLTTTGATNVTLPTTGTLMATSEIGSTVQAYDADLTAWAAITPSTGNLETTGTIQGNVVFNSYDTAQTLTYANHNSSIVQMTVADEVTMWDCETAGVGATVMLWARDAEKIEVVPASGDHFNLFNGTALTADYELDMAATAGTKVTLMCTADDTWSVYSETAACADGGAAD